MASEPSQPESQPERLLKEKEMTETMFAAGVSQMLEPLAVQHTDAIHKVQVSQRELETCVTQLSRKLEDAAQCSSLPQVGTYLQKLSDIKKRVGLLQSKLGNANTRLAKTYRYAEAQYGPLKSSNDAQQSKIDAFIESAPVREESPEGEDDVDEAAEGELEGEAPVPEPEETTTTEKEEPADDN